MAKFIPSQILEQVFEHQVKYHPREKISSKKKDIIRRRLQEGYTVDDLKKAIDGCHLNPFNNGRNDSGAKFLELKHSLKQDNVCRFIEIAEAADKQSQAKEARKNKRENNLHVDLGQPKVTEDELAEFRQMRKEMGV